MRRRFGGAILALALVSVLTGVGAVGLAVASVAGAAPESCCPAGGPPTQASPRPTPSPSPGPTRAPGLPLCVIGSWRVVTETAMVKFYSNADPFAATTSGKVYEFRADGTGTERYDNVTYTANSDGSTLRLTSNGSAEFTWTATGDTVTYLARTSTAVKHHWSVPEGESDVESKPQPDLNETDHYKCGGGQFEESNDTGYKSVWARTTGYGFYG
ncbi:lipocalin family protein [Longispora sp. K20-0274]|uniref:lipocalin family protein n=1 Tax=Longispora sp. K20-0274 TaxID=3088255 RepID=UPI00399BA970